MAVTQQLQPNRSSPLYKTTPPKMTTSTTAPTSTANSSAKRRSASPAKPASPGKDKGKKTATDDVPRILVEEDDEDEDEEDDEDDDDDDEDEDDDVDMDEDDEVLEEGADKIKEQIDPSAILPPGARRSTRGQKIDYSSPEAFKRAGLKSSQDEDEEMQHTSSPSPPSLVHVLTYRCYGAHLPEEQVAQRPRTLELYKDAKTARPLYISSCARTPVELPGFDLGVGFSEAHLYSTVPRLVQLHPRPAEHPEDDRPFARLGGRVLFVSGDYGVGQGD
ncbi:hypothetical protein EDB83DRAFT_2526602 [Lactarius deliciosus]|nr:hypothetical protein EDB83DRAFT_2526602 [Lactarius deliciosus]